MAGEIKGIKVDGVTHLIDYESLDNLPTLPTASVSTLGCVRVDGTTIVVDGNGVISLGLADANGVRY